MLCKNMGTLMRPLLINAESGDRVASHLPKACYLLNENDTKQFVKLKAQR